MSQTPWIAPVVLEGQHVVLEPLHPDHVSDLRRATRDGELWRLWYTSVPTPEGTADYVERALAGQQAHTAMPFAVRHRADDEIIGSTRYCNIDAANRRLEIGYTWYAQRHQRSAVNGECKLLLLRHAFETLGAIAVELRTHWHNLPSRTAIARLGAKQDGVLRNHMVMPDGTYRDTVVFSIIEGEWPGVKRGLEFRLAR